MVLTDSSKFSYLNQFDLSDMMIVLLLNLNLGVLSALMGV